MKTIYNLYPTPVKNLITGSYQVKRLNYVWLMHREIAKLQKNKAKTSQHVLLCWLRAVPRTVGLYIGQITKYRTIISLWSYCRTNVWEFCVQCADSGFYLESTWHMLTDGGRRLASATGYRVVKKLCQYVKPFPQNTGTWRTDRLTDGQTELQGLYIARQSADTR